MPKSRKRHRAKKHHRKHLNPLALDRMFDGIVHESFKVETPEVLYHYTSWSGAEGILRSRQFWATPHDCTNDEAELRSADEIIRDVAVDLRRRSYGAAAVTLDKFLEGYPRLQISHLRTVYMTCFSLARDGRFLYLVSPHRQRQRVIRDKGEPRPWADFGSHQSGWHEARPGLERSPSRPATQRGFPLGASGREARDLESRVRWMGNLEHCHFPIGNAFYRAERV